jgi:hypothetical protein
MSPGSCKGLQKRIKGVEQHSSNPLNRLWKEGRLIEVHFHLYSLSSLFFSCAREPTVRVRVQGLGEGEGVVLGRGDGEDSSGGGEEEEGEEVGSLEESEARRSRRQRWEAVASAVSSESMEAKRASGRWWRAER